MSLIFDALQRSQGERSGIDLSALPTGADLLQLVERHETSEREKALDAKAADLKVGTGQNSELTFGEPPTSASTSVESPEAEELRKNELLSRFQLPPVSLSAQ